MVTAKQALQLYNNFEHINSCRSLPICTNPAACRIIQNPMLIAQTAVTKNIIERMYAPIRTAEQMYVPLRMMEQNYTSIFAAENTYAPIHAMLEYQDTLRRVLMPEPAAFAMPLALQNAVQMQIHLISNILYTRPEYANQEFTLTDEQMQLLDDFIADSDCQHTSSSISEVPSKKQESVHRLLTAPELALLKFKQDDIDFKDVLYCISAFYTLQEPAMELIAFFHQVLGRILSFFSNLTF